MSVAESNGNGSGPADIIAVPAPAPSELSAFRVMNAVLRQRALVIAVTLLAGAIAIVPRLNEPQSYVSTAMFISQGQASTTSSVSGIAAQLGVPVQASAGVASPQFYPELIRSRTFLGQVAQASYVLPGARDSTPHTLIQLYGIQEKDVQLARDAAIRTLNDEVDVVPAPRTGIVTISVSTTDPRLSKAIADEILRQISEFNARMRQSGATAERQFLEGRVADESRQLQASQDRLEAFLAQNRDFRNSPTLVFQHERLDRDYQLHQTIYATLVQNYERAKFEEVRDTPTISVLGQPEIPLHPEPRGRLMALIRALILGFVFGT